MKVTHNSLYFLSFKCILNTTPMYANIIFKIHVCGVKYYDVCLSTSIMLTTLKAKHLLLNDYMHIILGVKFKSQVIQDMDALVFVYFHHFIKTLFTCMWLNCYPIASLF